MKKHHQLILKIFHKLPLIHLGDRSYGDKLYEAIKGTDLEHEAVVEKWKQIVYRPTVRRYGRLRYADEVDDDD